MRIEQRVAEAVSCYYGPLSAAWTDETAHNEYRPLPEGKPLSFGQCVPTSCVLIDELQRDFPNEDMQLLGGHVRARTEVSANVVLNPIISSHVWIGWKRPGIFKDYVIDATPDQADSDI